MKKKLLSLLVLLLTVASGAWAQDRFFLEVSGTSATLKWGEPISNDNPSLYPGSSWKYQGTDWTDKSGITTITVDASCTNCSAENISALFYKFIDLQTINNIENIKTDAVKYLGSMFQNCSSLQTLDLSSWNTENVTSMSGMFRGCTSLQTLDLSSFNTGKVNGMSYMFKDCSSLTTIYVGDGWSTDQLTSSSSSTEMFDGCVSLPNWDNASPVIDKTNAHTGDGGYLTYKATFDYAFTVVPAEHGSGTIKFYIGDEEVKGAMQADEGKTVTMTITPDEGWIVDATSVKAESYSTWEAAGAPSRRAPGNITILGDVTLTKSTTAENTWTFTMPAASVLVSAAYLKSSTLAFKPADRTNLMEIKVGDDKVNVKDSKTVKIEKVEGVIEGTPVKLTANTGYKFRKVEVKKGGSAVLAPALENGATVVIICNWGYDTTTFTYTNNGGTFSGQASGYDADNFYYGLELNGKNLSFGASEVDLPEILSVGITFNTESSAYSYTGKGEDFVSFTISVNGTDVTDQLSELK